jgi:hypothetical protein
MRTFLITGLAALAVSACTPAEEQHGALSEGCGARATATWNTPADPNASIEAITTGPDCARAVATLIIRNGSGAPIYSETHIPSQVMTLAEASAPAAMQTALQEWIDPAGNTTMHRAQRSLNGPRTPTARRTVNSVLLLPKVLHAKPTTRSETQTCRCIAMCKAWRA